MIHTFSGLGRSKFMSAISEELREQKKTLASGRQIIVHFDADRKGYPGTFEVKINQAACSFTVDFKNTDPTRFPARIKAAARALCQEGYDGTYKISHKSGALTICKS